MHIWISALQNVFPGFRLFWSSGSQCSLCLCCGTGYVRVAECHLLHLHMAGAAASAALGNIGQTVKLGNPSVEKLSSHLPHALLKWCHWTFFKKKSPVPVLCFSQGGPVVCCSWDFCPFEFLVKNDHLPFVKSKMFLFYPSESQSSFLSYLKKIVCCQTAAC